MNRQKSQPCFIIPTSPHPGFTFSTLTVCDTLCLYPKRVSGNNTHRPAESSFALLSAHEPLPLKLQGHSALLRRHISARTSNTLPDVGLGPFEHFGPPTFLRARRWWREPWVFAAALIPAVAYPYPSTKSSWTIVPRNGY